MVTRCGGCWNSILIFCLSAATSIRNLTIFGNVGLFLSPCRAADFSSISRGSIDAKASCRRRAGLGPIDHRMSESPVEYSDDNAHDDGQ
jgi:hypothetical protein